MEIKEPVRQNLPFAIPTDAPRIIKVVGVGGGGSNAVHNMYRKGIHNVSFAVCNTDLQAMQNSPIPKKVQLGLEITEGLGAGNDPDVARKAAEESREEIERLFDDGTKMAFVTAGMGGGTGTGAAPVVAEIARSKGILTVGIVTIPFKFEMTGKIKQALRGVMEISKHVDALLVINNQRLIDIYPKMEVSEGFKIVDEVLTTATKSIAEIITAVTAVQINKTVEFKIARQIVHADFFTVPSGGNIALDAGCPCFCDGFINAGTNAAFIEIPDSSVNVEEDAFDHGVPP